MNATVKTDENGLLRIDLENHREIEALVVDDKGNVGILYRGERRVLLRGRPGGSVTEYGPVDIGPSAQVRLVP